MRTTEQLQTLGADAGVESLTDMYSQLVVFAVLNFRFFLLLLGCINGMASAILYTVYAHFFPAHVQYIHHLSVFILRGQTKKITPSTDDSVVNGAGHLYLQSTMCKGYCVLCLRNANV